ncbi:MAG: type VI secretion system tube protein Hcp [Verrucomicrobiales bacterium]|nr:type VI secretion system tube protein Hcp [Verrucomicrobiales bacterium]
MKNHPTYPYHCAGVAPRISRWMLIVLLSLTSTVVSHAQVDVFIRFLKDDRGNSFPGESDDSVYKSTEGWCRIRSFSLGAELTFVTPVGGGGAGRRVSSIGFDIGKEMKVISPSIFLAMAKGSPFKMMEMVVRKQGARSGEAYLKYEFLDALPIRQNWAGNEDEPIETIRFEYEALRMTLRSQSSTGELGAPVVAKWDFKENKEAFGSAVP